ncbi:hypothetical protein TNCV_2775341 [Trichonephila clavipes]|nr:hypothetical protein TNCV_2775341 [Trichonephila clavipes]
MFEKVSVLLAYTTVSPEEFVVVDYSNVCTHRERESPTIMADKDILEFVQNSKSTIDKDSDDENEMNKEAPVPTLSEMKNIIISMRSYLVSYSNGEMNSKMGDIELFVDNLMLKKVICK